MGIGAYWPRTQNPLDPPGPTHPPPPEPDPHEPCGLLKSWKGTFVIVFISLASNLDYPGSPGTLVGGQAIVGPPMVGAAVA